MKLGERRNFYIFLLTILVGICVLGFLFKKQQDFLVVSFLYVGQGDAVFIEAPNGVQVLVDAGPDRGVVRELGKVMPFWDRSIDMIIPTHADKDHIGGFPEVLKRFTIESIYDMGSDATTGIFEAYESYKQDEHSAIKEARAGDTIILDSEHGVYLRVLFPSENIEDIERNDTSTVVQLVYGDIEFMLTGDAGVMVENYLVYEYDNFLASDVLKAGHHGSRTSSSQLFLEKVQPKYVVISAGENNSYGHPHQEVVDAIKSFGSKIFETKYGTVQFVTNGKDVQVVQ